MCNMIPPKYYSDVSLRIVLKWWQDVLSMGRTEWLEDDAMEVH